MTWTLYTIGCSNHPIDAFLRLLKSQGIEAIVDVRSVPYSAQTPHFNAPVLIKSLKEAGIFYLSFSEEFGARRQEKEAYRDGQVDFAVVSKLPKFLAGIKRVEEGLEKGLKIAIMCTEKDPINCHRFHLVSRELSKQLNSNVLHIGYDGSVESNASVEDRMRRVFSVCPTFEMMDKAREEVSSEFPQIKNSGDFDKIVEKRVGAFVLDEIYQYFSRKVAYKNTGDEGIRE